MDKGENPRCGGWAGCYANCGRYHGHDTVELIREQRPFEIGGFPLSPTRVISGDMMIYPRLVWSITVRFGDKVVPARSRLGAQPERCVPGSCRAAGAGPCAEVRRRSKGTLPGRHLRPGQWVLEHKRSAGNP